MNPTPKLKLRAVDYSLIIALLLLTSSAIGGYVTVKSDIAVTQSQQCEIIKRLDRIEANTDKLLLLQHGE